VGGRAGVSGAVGGEQVSQVRGQRVAAVQVVRVLTRATDEGCKGEEKGEMRAEMMMSAQERLRASARGWK
jgi:hypothetical protein